jgi:hypothetical protein
VNAATESIYQNQILFRVQAGFSDLSTRKLELDRITDGEPGLMRELYSTLAEDFRKIDSPMMADACDRRAEQWRRIGAREGAIDGKEQ